MIACEWVFKTCLHFDLETYLAYVLLHILVDAPHPTCFSVSSWQPPSPALIIVSITICLEMNIEGRKMTLAFTPLFL